MKHLWFSYYITSIVSMAKRQATRSQNILAALSLCDRELLYDAEAARPRAPEHPTAKHRVIEFGSIRQVLPPAATLANREKGSPVFGKESVEQSAGVSLTIQIPRGGNIRR
jgi:hypothetical protein